MTTQHTIGEIAAEIPSSVRVFEKYGIDYCCGGQRPLEEVCREHGLSAEALLGELRAAVPGNGAAQDWSRASLRDLMDHIVSRRHVYLRTELPVIAERLVKVLEAHGPRHGSSLAPLARTFTGLREELETHMRKEEVVLFPAIAGVEAAQTEGRKPASLPFGTLNNPIRMMMHEHDSAGQALDQMRSLTGGYTLPEDACATYRALFEGLQALEADLHQHIHLENNILFPRAVRLEAEALAHHRAG